jgi:hypothetical protein
MIGSERERTGLKPKPETLAERFTQCPENLTKLTVLPLAYENRHKDRHAGRARMLRGRMNIVDFRPPIRRRPDFGRDEIG